MTVSNLIRDLREARSMTRPQLAARSSIARAHLWAVETGKFTPGLATLEKIASGLGVGLIRLITKSDSVLLEDPFVKSVTEFLPRLSVQHRLFILKTLQAAPKKFPRFPR